MNFRDRFVVYFIKPVGLVGPIKIGLSENPQRRIDEFRTWSPFELEIIGTIAGSWADEQFLHECLAADHSHGEWFFPSREVLRAVDEVISSGGIKSLRARLQPVENLRSRKNRATRLKRGVVVAEKAGIA
jgi:hypothetical protein